MKTNSEKLNDNPDEGKTLAYLGLVSVIIRTVHRPAVLWEAVQSVLNQTYPHFEIIIVEDGEEVNEENIKKKISDSRIYYYSTKKPVGRSCAGNQGLKFSNGDFLIFLDDDDVFFPNHLEILIRQLFSDHFAVAAYSIAYEAPTEIVSYSPYVYKETSPRIRYAEPFNRLKLMMVNYIPIQSILFRRELYDKAGGFDESIGLLEDWDLWIRYSLMGDFVFVPIISSKYRVPKNKIEGQRRGKSLEKWEQKVRDKQKSQIFTSSVAQLTDELNAILAERTNIRKIAIYGLLHPIAALRSILHK